MKLLVDSHALMWFAAGHPRLSKRARSAITEPGNIRWVSVASWWEIAIKVSTGKLDLETSFADFVRRRHDEGFRTLGIEPAHAAELVNLPFHHRDPFDRMLIAQALHEGMPICTDDGEFAAYGVRIIW
jgi:PIN domain nuclease of toxin-antitoxin system